MSKNQKFEDSLKRLEEIVDQMEKGDLDLDLDKALALFEEGIKLVHVCSSKLEETKRKVEILIKKGDKMTAEPFTAEEKTGNNREEDNDDLFK